MRIFAAALAVLFASPVAAQENCGPVASVYQMLTLKYGEIEVENRTVPHPQDASVMVRLSIWVNAETMTWTFTGVFPNGVMCLFASGENYEGQLIQDFMGEGA